MENNSEELIYRKRIIDLNPPQNPLRHISFFYSSPSTAEYWRIFMYEYSDKTTSQKCAYQHWKSNRMEEDIP